MLYGILLSIMVLDGLFLGVVILLQSGKGGGLAAVGGGASPTDGILAGRQATTMLTRATWTGGTLFMVLALVLSILSSRSSQPSSILQDGINAPAQTAPQPVIPNTGNPGGAGPVVDPGAAPPATNPSSGRGGETGDPGGPGESG